MKKKFVTLLLAGALAASMALPGCGSTETDSSAEVATEEVTEGSASEDIAEEEEALGDLAWPDYGLAALLPVPDSAAGSVTIDSAIQFSAKVAMDSEDEFNAYVDACMGYGYTVGYARYDTAYYAYSTDDYYLSLSYKDGVCTVALYAPYEEDSGEDTGEDTTESSLSGIRPEFQEAMDSYEAFIDKYIEFMEAYADSGYSSDMVSEYSEYMSEYAECVAEFKSLGEQDMSDEELQLYAEVQARTAEKLLAATY
ncbi:MAG: hypothetical protein LUG27_05480 [Clostridiales bacterium]|nr:hypothetical protein [Clostridiales bacterium]